jgi:hypothetical protein
VSYQGLCLSEESSVFCLGGWGFAVRKAQFRAAIQLQFDFHRAVYNLGTVLVSEWRVYLTQHFNACCTCPECISLTGSVDMALN